MVGADKTQWSPHIHAPEGENSDSLSEFSCFGAWSCEGGIYVGP